MKLTHQVSKTEAAYMQAMGSDGQGPQKIQKEEGFEAKTKEIAGSIGGFFKSGFGFMKKSTASIAEKFNNSGVKESLGKAADAAKGGIMTAYDKSKEFGGKIADTAVEVGGKMKHGAVVGFVK